MLRGMTAIDFKLWRAFLTLSPQGAEREDIRTASICQAIWNVQIAKGTRPGHKAKLLPHSDFLLQFGDAPDPTTPTRKQTPAEQWAILVAAFKAAGATPKTKG